MKKIIRFAAVLVMAMVMGGSVAILTSANTGHAAGAFLGGESGGESVATSVAWSSSTTVYNFAYTGNVQSITGLPAGKYKLEVWGASGGSANGNPIGLGGYSYGQISYSGNNNTLYVYVGGAGTNAPQAIGTSSAGGFNGGGAASNTAGNGHLGAGGGGATDFRTVGGAWNVAAGLNSRLIVAGGGGGAASVCGTNQQTAGHAGGATGISSKNFSSTYGAYYSTGGTQTAGGSGYSGWAHGTFGAGASGATCGAGGGGGWWGGGAAYTACGGGGSGYLSSSIVDGKMYAGGDGYIGTNFSTTVQSEAFPKPDGTGNEKGHSGNGYARLTVINRPPESKSELTASAARGAESNALSVTGLASDPEGYDAQMTYAEKQIYTSASGSTTYNGVSIGEYLGIENYSGTSFTVKPKRMVGNAGNGYMETFYIKVQDNYSGVAYIPFKVNTQDKKMSVVSRGQSNAENAQYYNTASGHYGYFGASDTSTAPERENAGGKIYHPSGLNMPNTLYVNLALSKNRPLTIRASELLGDGDSGDQVMFSVSSGSNDYYTVTPGEAVSAGGKSGYGSVTVSATGTAVTTGWLTETLTVKSIEKASGAELESVSVTVVLRVDNIRPWFALTNVDGDGRPVDTGLTGVPKAKLSVGGSATISLSELVKDPDYVQLTFATDAGSVKVPGKEYIPLDKYGSVLGLSGYYYGAGGANGAAGDSLTTGEGSVATGFASNWVASYDDTEGAKEASVTYAVSGESITFTGKYATRYSYDAGRAMTGAGHFYVLVRVIDHGDPSDEGLWYPIAIEVEDSAPRELSDKPVLEGSVGDSYILSPMATAGSEGTGVGLYEKDGALTGSGVKALATDADVSAVSENAAPGGAVYGYTEFLSLTNRTGNFASENEAWKDYFRLESVTLYAPMAYLGRIPVGEQKLIADGGWIIAKNVTAGGESDLFSYYGVKVTFLRKTPVVTGKEYVEFDSLGVTGTAKQTGKDTVGAGKTLGNIRVLVKIGNRGPELKAGDEINGLVKDGSARLVRNAAGSYVYTLYNKDKIRISAYDLVKDSDLPELSDLSDYTLNPGYDGEQAEAMRRITAGHTLVMTSEKKTDAATSDAAGEYPLESLRIGSVSATMNGDKITYTRGEERGMEYVEVSGVTRTLTGSNVLLTVTVTDDGGLPVTANVEFVILNNAPAVKAPDRVYELVADGIAGYSALELGAADETNADGTVTEGILTDRDSEDVAGLSFVTSEGARIRDGAGTDLTGAGYMRAEIVNGKLRITALSSTQNIERGAYVTFYATDGKTQVELCVRVEVLNSDPTFNAGGFESAADNKSVWNISPATTLDFGRARYLTSDKDVANKLGAEYSKVFATESDGRQGLILDAVGYTGADGKPRSVAPVAAMSENAGEPIAVVYDGNGVYGAGQNLESGFVRLMYFDENLDEIPASGYGDAQYYDANGAWKVTRWAVAIQPTTPFVQDTYANVKVSVRDAWEEGGNSYGLAASYNADRTGAAEVTTGRLTATIQVRINSTGIINNHTAYATNGNVYGVEYDDAGTTKWALPRYEVTSGTYEVSQFTYGTIEVGAAGEVRVPMSYFAMPEKLVADSGSKSYAGYYSTSEYDVTSSVVTDLTLTDGKQSWTGAGIADNPYLIIGASGDSSASNWTEAYYNKYYSYGTTEAGGQKYASVVAGQNEFLENKFGLAFAKKSQRSPAEGLTLSVRIRERSATGEPVGGENGAITVSVKITVANSEIELKETSVDVNLTLAAIDKTVALVPEQQTAEDYGPEYAGNGNVQYVTYRDGDYGGSVYDEARFKATSLKGMSAGDAARVHKSNGTWEQVSAGMQAGVEDYVKAAGGTDALAANANPNLGTDGSRRGYEEYFSVVATDGKSLMIHPLNRTRVSESVLSDEAAALMSADPSLTAEAARAAVLARRGLKEKLRGGVTATYYPLRVLVYDDYEGTGWGSASYAALTLNVFIDNSAPAVSKAVGDPVSPENPNARTFTINLAMGEEYSINLAEVVVDKDMLLTESGYFAQDFTGASEIQKETMDLFGGGQAGGMTPATGGVQVQSAQGTDAVDLDVMFGQLKFKAKKRLSSNASARFTVRFSDDGSAASGHLTAETLTFIVTMANKAPSPADNLTLDIKMRTGDSFTLLTTPYDRFMQADFNKYLTTNAAGKTIVKPEYLVGKNPNRETAPELPTTVIDYLDLSPNSSQTLGEYANMTEAGLTGEYKLNPDSTQSGGPTGSMGVMAVATDDTPWQLRFKSEGLADTTSMVVTKLNPLYEEGRVLDEKNLPDAGHALLPTAIRFTARGACENVLWPLTVTDGEGGTMTVTLKITVVSSAPQVLTAGAQLGGKTAGEVWAEKGLAKDNPEGTDAGFTLRMRAGESVTLALSELAYDGDLGETEKMTLCNAYSNKPFSFNGSADGAGETPFVTAAAAPDGKSFTLRCRDVYTTAGYDTLEVYVMDYGSKSFPDKALKVTIRIYTEYSAVTGASGTTDYEISAVDEYVPGGSVLGLLKSDGNAQGRIEDADYAAGATASYTTRVYALMTERSGVYAPMSANELADVVKNGLIEASKAPKYLIGQITASGAQLPARGDESALALSRYVSRYFTFELNNKGEVAFAPKTATLKKTIQLHFEVTKVIESGAQTEGVALTAGATYRLTVKNSAPAETEEIDGVNDGLREIAGPVGTERIFKVYDPADPSALFSDPDSSDSVTLLPVSYGSVVADSVTVDGVTTQTNPGWKEGNGLKRAFEIEDRGDGTVRVRINRRIDNPANPSAPVTIPLVFRARDSMGLTAETTVLMTVVNSAPELYAPAEPKEGYSLTRDAQGNYTLAATVVKGTDGLRLDLRDFVYDEDITSGALNDVFGFIPGMGDEASYYTGGEYTIERVNGLSVEPLFKVVQLDRLTLRVTAESYSRGAVGVCYLVVADASHTAETPSRTAELRIELTVGNNAPELKSEAEGVTIQGGEKGEIDNGEPDGVFEEKLFDIRDFVTDLNETDLTADSTTRVRVASLYLNASADIDYTGAIDPDNPNSGLKDALVSVGLPSGDASGQKFYVRAKPHYYGTQILSIYVRDDGGAGADGWAEAEIRITITVAQNLSNITLTDLTIAKGKTMLLTAETLLGKTNSRGYVVESMTSPASESGIEVTRAEGEGAYRIKALKETGEGSLGSEVSVRFAMGEKVRHTLTFRVKVVKNHEPTVLADFADRTYYKDDDNAAARLSADNVAELSPYTFLTDPEGDVLTLHEASSKKSMVVKASVDRERNVLILRFKASGDSVITVTVSDETGEVHEVRLTARNAELPPLNFFKNIVANIQAKPLLYIVIAAAVLLLLIVLIAIVAAVRKKKRMRDEIEALLVSEMELEEQMLKLAASPAPTFYQSYGYLPPTQQTLTPGLMLGEGKTPGTTATYPNTTPNPDFDNADLDDIDPDSF